MKKKLKCILLVDDNEHDNFFHRKAIESVDCTERIEVATSGFQALKYLKSCIHGDHPYPDVIFLDINMPGMNAWEFLEEYKTVSPDFHNEIILLMLTTSTNPDDKEKASKYNEITDYLIKPLTAKEIKGILKKHFSEISYD